MGVDTRNLILKQLWVTLQTVPGFITYARNRGELDDDQRPSLTLLDADEKSFEQAFQRGRVAASPNLISLEPEIYISLKAAKPDNKDVGDKLDAFRAAVLKAIQQDNALSTLCGVAQGGEIQYRGCSTDLGRNRPMNGEMGLDIAFVYPFKPSEL